MISKLRNIGIMAHVDAGKTTLTERILFNTGRIHAIGDVDDGNAEMDWRALEKKHGITISAAATSCVWRDCAITIIDTPGHVDFTIEVERSLRVLDSAIAVFSAVSGVEPQSEAVWRQAERFGAPRLCFINKMDQPGANFAMCVDMLRERLDARPIVLQLPLVVDGRFSGVIDLVSMSAHQWDAGDPAPRRADIPDDTMDAAHLWRRRLLEDVVEFDDEAMAQYLENENALDERTIKALIRKACITNARQAVLCGSAYRNIGVQPLLDAIVDFCPSPLDRPPVEGVDPRSGAVVTRAASVNAPLAALVSKVQTSRYGALSFVRIYAGRMRRGMQFVNGNTGKTERIGRLLRTHANQETEIDEAGAGEVIALVGLKATRASETLCDPAHPIVLGGFECPEPVIEAVIEAASPDDHARMGRALAEMTREDPSLRVAVEPETGQTLIAGMGELHLTICVETLKEEHNVTAKIGPPRVAYREAITQRAEIDCTHRKQSGGPGQMARVRLVFEPRDDDEAGLLFESRVGGGVVPAEFMPSIEKALQQCLATGALLGYPMIGLKATLIDGGFHAKDSSGLAFELATREAFKRGMAQAEPVLLEPIMRVVVTTPGDYLGDLIGDLLARRGSIVASDLKGGAHELIALAPLANLFGYVSALRSLSQGRASFVMRLDRYAPVPKSIQQQVIDHAC